MNDLTDLWDSFEDEVLDDALGLEHIDDLLDDALGEYGDDLQQAWEAYFQEQTGIPWDEANQPDDWEDLIRRRLLPELKYEIAARIADRFLLTGEESPLVEAAIKRILSALVGRKIVEKVLQR